jgi:hypothetical protein
MHFGDAIAQLRKGHKLTRTGWNGKGLWLELQVPDEHSKMTLPYIYINYPTGSKVPWLASQTDMLSGDWYDLTDDTADLPNPVADTVYPSIKAAAEHLTTFKRGENAAIDIAYDLLRAAFFAETTESLASTFPKQPTE